MNSLPHCQGHIKERLREREESYGRGMRQKRGEERELMKGGYGSLRLLSTGSLVLCRSSLCLGLNPVECQNSTQLLCCMRIPAARMFHPGWKDSRPYQPTAHKTPPPSVLVANWKKKEKKEKTPLKTHTLEQ